MKRFLGLISCGAAALRLCFPGGLSAHDTGYDQNRFAPDSDDHLSGASPEFKKLAYKTLSSADGK